MGIKDSGAILACFLGVDECIRAGFGLKKELGDQGSVIWLETLRQDPFRHALFLTPEGTVLNREDYPPVIADELTRALASGQAIVLTSPEKAFEEIAASFPGVVAV